MFALHEEHSRRGRTEQTHWEFNLLRTSIAEWFAGWKGQSRGRQFTRLRVLNNLLDGFLGDLQDQFSRLDDETDSNNHAQACRALRSTTMWIRQLWEYYQEKFDQRRTPHLENLVLAADEVVWSCSARLAKAGTPRLATPLCYVRPKFSLDAVTRDNPFPRLPDREDASKSLGKFVREIPVPLIGIPPWLVDAPWWLIYLGHEIGHHVIRDSKGFLEIQSWLTRVGGSDWGKWTEEVFSDLFSVAVFGPWAHTALSEFLWQAPNKMLEEESNYPPPIVRLEMTIRYASSLDLEQISSPQERRWEHWKTTLQDAEPGQIQRIDHLLADVDRLVADVPALLMEEATLSQSILESDQNDPVDGWTKHLLGHEELSGKPSIESVRQVVCAGVSGWAHTLADSAQGSEQRQKLRERLPDLLQMCAESGDRAPDPSDSSLAEKATTQVEYLLDQFGWPIKG